MAELDDRMVSRRALIQGAGALGSVAAMAGVGALRLPPAAALPFSAEPSDVSTLAVTAGLTYLTVGLDAFLPPTVFQTTGRGVGTLSFVALGANGLYASVPIPSGVTIREVAFVAYNGSPNPSDDFTLSEVEIATAQGAQIAAMSFPANSGYTVQSTSIDHATNGDFWYRAFAPTLVDGPVGIGIAAVRVGYQGPLALVPVPQVRKLDTRNPGPLSGKISSGQTKTLSLAPEVPAGAALALLNLTVDQTEASGYVSLFAANVSWPGTSSINWFGTGQTLANAVTVAVSPAQAINILAGGPGSSHVIVDLVGYYR